MVAFDPPYSPTTFRTLSSTNRGRVVTATNNCVAGEMGWLTSTYPGTGQIASFGATDEAHLREPASVAFGLATLLASGQHQTATTGYTDVQLRDAAIRLIDSFALTHAGNGGNWGGVVPSGVIVPDSSTFHWQGAYWVALTAVAARLLWSSLTPTQRTQVDNMVTSEANRFIGYAVPYMRSPRGSLVTPGDTKAEENGWNAWVLLVAAATMPSHANAAAWLTKGLELSLSVTATPAFPTSKRPFNGLTGYQLAAGSNIEFSGFLENHGLVNPNYMATCAQSWVGGLTYGWLRGTGSVPAATLAAADLVYQAMSSVTFTNPPQLAPGGTIYTTGSAAIYYPGGAEGDATRMANYMALDAVAHCVSADAGAPTTADTWLALHAQNQLDQQAGSSTARRSYWDLQHGAWAVLADWIVATGGIASSNAPAATLLAA